MRSAIIPTVRCPSSPHAQTGEEEIAKAESDNVIFCIKFMLKSSRSRYHRRVYCGAPRDGCVN
jgi:hypothetical protein